MSPAGAPAADAAEPPAAAAGGPPARAAAIVFAVLLAATFGAFLIASRLKAEPAVLHDLVRVRWFSPNGDGHRDVEPITFRADLDGRAAVDIVDADGARVRRVAGRLRIRRGRTVRVRWDGREDDGTRAPDGAYRMRLILLGEGRSVLSGKAFNVDTRPPDPAVVVDRRTPIVSPGQPVRFRVRGTGASARPRLRVLRTDVAPIRPVREWRGRRGRHSFSWDGRDAQGRPAPPGTYLIAVTARDKAGNQGFGPPLPPAAGRIEGRPGVTVRSLAVQPPVRPVRAGELAAFRVDARGRTYGWRVRRLGVRAPALVNRRPKRGTTLLLRAPEGPPGVYLLEVSSHGARTSVPFAVSRSGATRRGRPLVVLPVVTWLGEDPVDDSRRRDGLPDTLRAGSPVAFPRLYGFTGGLPAGFARDVAPLLVWLDRNDVAYDVTTDLDLTLSGDGPRAASRRGLLLAGAPEWVSRGLARRLRRYVAEGGRVALFGPKALRAGVTVGDRQLSRPTIAGAVDAFGARLAAVRALGGGSPRVLTVLQDDVGLGLLEGFGGELRGFAEVEELVSAGEAKVVTSVGDALTDAEAAQAEAANRTPRPERPALSAARDGKGLVIRIGLPQWAQRLAAGDAAVGQLTHNVVDLLRGARPRPRTAG